MEIGFILLTILGLTLFEIITSIDNGTESSSIFPLLGNIVRSFHC